MQKYILCIYKTELYSLLNTYIKTFSLPKFLKTVSYLRVQQMYIKISLLK